MKTLLAASLAFLAGPAFAQSADTDDMARRVDELSAELAAMKKQLSELEKQNAAAPSAAPAAEEPSTVFTSYGEINYNRPTHEPENTQADLRRFVLGFQHRFDPQTKLVTEIEFEHAVTSRDDPGEAEIEQAMIEHAVNPTWAVRAGLFLMPVGLLNENHEPTAFYGVERNFVETAIIPTTWREGGAQIVGAFDNGVTLQTGVTTGFDLTKWDATSTEGAESPLGSIHQELALAKASDLSVFGALNWRGVPGLLLGGSLFTGDATHGQALPPSQVVVNASVTLWDLHARWTPGRWDFAALYASGSISNTAELNRTLVGFPTLIPEAFDGGYVQVAYKLWMHEGQELAPFVRFEAFNTGRRYADLGPGVTPAARPTEQVATVGMNYQFTPGIVVKADVQHFHEDQNADRVDLGLGWSF